MKTLTILQHQPLLMMLVYIQLLIWQILLQKQQVMQLKVKLVYLKYVKFASSQIR